VQTDSLVWLILCFVCVFLLFFDVLCFSLFLRSCECEQGEGSERYFRGPRFSWRRCRGVGGAQALRVGRRGNRTDGVAAGMRRSPVKRNRRQGDPHVLVVVLLLKQSVVC
jgi:hypothetical protein